MRRGVLGKSSQTLMPQKCEPLVQKGRSSARGLLGRCRSRLPYTDFWVRAKIAPCHRSS
jgi:hypothetical protein